MNLFNNTKKRISNYNHSIDMIPLFLLDSLKESHPEEIMWLFGPDMSSELNKVIKTLGLYTALGMSSIDKKVLKAVERDFLEESEVNKHRYIHLKDWMEDAEKGNNVVNYNDEQMLEFTKKMFGHYICLSIMNEYEKKKDPYQFTEQFANKVGEYTVGFFITQTIPQLNKKLTPNAGFNIKKIGLSIISILAIIVFYGAVNGGLIGVQNVFKKEEIAELDLLEEELLEEESVIQEQEDYLVDLENEISGIESEMEEIESIIDSYESDYPDGLPEEEYQDYLDTIDNYNSLLQDYESLMRDYDSEYATYLDSIDFFNEKVVEAEGLAEEVGSTWVILPVGKK
ncbi:hypothetical protein [Metabacillus arenae]|uniref:Uncharacterized protein n=1 Tax=Metabacillus arenae TaxID=2771434 RepID=A0A926RXZ6_9BACI|nr:hypothetical protein [Metabacillus arenae]MBD1382413.1 hypothetical protein [Metabacillus arenae]